MSKYVVDKMVENGEKTWDLNKGDYTELSAEIISFMREYEELCKKHDISLSHEDGHGAFQFDCYDERNIEWVANGQKWEYQRGSGDE